MNKKVFLDTNVVADIIDAHRSNHFEAIKLVENLINQECEICISEDMISTLFYISKDKLATLMFFQNVILVDWKVLSFGKNILSDSIAMALEKEADLEDILQCLCAKHHGCDTFITNDKTFYNCGMTIVCTEEFE